MATMTTIAAGMKNPESLILIVGGLLVLFFLVRWNRQMMRRTQQRSAADPADTQRVERSAINVRDQLDELMVQLEELVRVTTAQIETRAAKVEVLLKEADEKIARLAGLTGAAPAHSPPSESDSRPEHQKIYELADAGRSAVQIAQEVGRDVGEIELILALRRRLNPR